MVKDKRDEFIEENLPLVHSVANRFKGRADYDDLFQAGCVGLIKAVDGFDESRGFKFSTYAVPVIMGEIKRIFRDGGAIKVSRSLKEKSVKIQYLREKFIKKNNREPTLSEISEISGIESEELSQILGVLNPVISINTEYDEQNGDIDIPVDNNDDMLERIDIHIATSKLTRRQQLLLKYRYFEGKTQCECASLLNISQVQVSRNEKDLLKKLREFLE